MRRSELITAAWAAMGILQIAADATAVPAFPDAAGYGSETPGGRGGQVIAVTSLEDAGPGSLREALAAKGPRIVIFRTGGTIRLKSPLVVSEPFVTVAGQTATGEGITLSGAELAVETHDVVLRYLRCRREAAVRDTPPATGSALRISGADAHDIVVDHCSLSWPAGTGPGVHLAGNAHDVTLSCNIIAQTYSVAVSPSRDGVHHAALQLEAGITRTTLHHNLLALWGECLPATSSGRHVFINNLVYLWESCAAASPAGGELDLVANTFRFGPFCPVKPPLAGLAGDASRVYAEGNEVQGPLGSSIVEWTNLATAPAEKHQAREPFQAAFTPRQTAAAARSSVLADAGAVAPMRDRLDRQIVRSARLRLGPMPPFEISRQADPLPTAGAPSPADSDGDGMPDDWERAQGFNPADLKDGGVDGIGDGRTNVEAYLEQLAKELGRGRPDVQSLVLEEAADPSAPVEVTAGGVRLPLIRVPGRAPLFYAHAWVQGELSIRARTVANSAIVPTLLPARMSEGAVAAPGRVDFTAAEEGSYVVEFGREPNLATVILLLAPFGEELDSARTPGLIDATRYGVTWGRSNVTARLQAALNAAGKAGGGTVYVGGGDHEITSLRVPSRVTLHLDRGAVLYAVPEAADTPAIVFEDVSGAGLAGPGVIDGRGHEGVRKFPLVLVRGCRDVRIRDILLRNAAGPAVQIHRAEDVRITRAGLITNFGRPGAGGLVIHNAQFVACEGLFICADADAVSVDSVGKTDAFPANLVSVRETTLISGETGLAIGPENQALIQGILFDSVDVVQAPRGITVTQRKSGGMQLLRFNDIRLRLTAHPGETDGGVPFRIISTAPAGTAGINNVLIESLDSNAARTSMIENVGGGWIETLSLRGLRLRPEPRHIGSEEMPVPLLSLGSIRKASLKNMTVIWPEPRGRGWSGALETRRMEDFEHAESDIIQQPPAPR